ncbi:MAG TPA: hypothetical protein VJP78_12360 [Thermoleophilia bacterium]|nr:hypothetical protein [Thermoleophilia bacterium]
MPSAPVTEAEVRAILSQDTSTDDPVEWWPKSDQAWVEARLHVRHPQPHVNLSLIATVNRLAAHKFSFVLLLNGAHRIVGYDANGSHINTHTDTNEWRMQTHEHRWTDACHGRWACAPPAAPPALREAFHSFCARHGVRFTGKWSDPRPMQLDLGLEET